MFFATLLASGAGAFVVTPAKCPRLTVNYVMPPPLKKLTEHYRQKEPDDLEDINHVKNLYVMYKLRPFVLDPRDFTPPVHFEADAEGNFELLPPLFWQHVVTTLEQFKYNFWKDDFTRVIEWLDHIRISRGVTEGPRKISRMYQFFDEDHESEPIVSNEKLSFATRLAKIVGPLALAELAVAKEQGDILDHLWDHSVILPESPELWPRMLDAAGNAYDPDDPDAQRDRTPEFEYTWTDDFIIEPPTRPEAPRDYTPVDQCWTQLNLNMGYPTRTGAVHFEHTLKAMQSYPKRMRRLPPRNVILGKLPPGVTTKPRSDFMDSLLSCQIPLDGVDGDCGIIVGDQKVRYEVGVPVIFDATYPYSMYNAKKNRKTVKLLHFDFWQLGVEDHEKEFMQWFFVMSRHYRWHPSARHVYTKRMHQVREQHRREWERNNKEGRRKRQSPPRSK